MSQWGLVGFAGKDGDTEVDCEEHIIGTKNWQQSMDSPEMERWRKARRKRKCKVVRLKDKLVVGTTMLYRNIEQDGKVEKFKCRLAV